MKERIMVRLPATSCPVGAEELEAEVAHGAPAELHALVLHALHVSGGAAAVASISGRREPDVVLERLRSAIVGALPAGATVTGKLAVLMPAVCEEIAITVECGGRGVEVKASPRGTPPNVAAFVLKAPALDRLLLVRSRKPGRAWELPGGAIEPGETPADAAGREVVEEAGVYFRAEGGGWTVDGCEVFRGTSHASLTVPGGDVTSARWFTPDEARPLKLSDLPTAKLIRDWYMGRR